MLASCGNDDTTRIWDTSTGQLIKKYIDKSTNGVASVVWSPDQTEIAEIAYDGVLVIRRLT